MSALPTMCAVVPVKCTLQAKRRLAGILSAAQRRELALAMLDERMLIVVDIEGLMLSADMALVDEAVA